MMRYLPRFQRAYCEMAMMADREQWSRQAIDAYQLQRLNRVWGYAAQHVPYYGDLKKKRALPHHFEDLSEFAALMPVLDKKTIRQHHGEFLSRRAPQGRGRWFCTGGSTGEPMRFFWSDMAYQEILRCRYRAYASWDIDIFDRMTFVWGHGGMFTPGWRGRMQRAKQCATDRLRNRIRISAYDLSREAMRGALERIGNFQPASIYGFTNAVHLLSQEAEAMDFHCDSLRMITLSTEPVTGPIRRQIEKAFGVPVVSEYGASECGIIAFEGPDRKLRVREDVALVETVANESAQYDILLTVLINPHFPLLRYRIGDVTDQILHRPAQGFSVMNSVTGRCDDIILTRKGRRIHPALLEGVFEHESNCRRYRVHQKIDGTIDVQIELHDSHAGTNVQAMRQKLMMLVEGYEVDICVTHEIALTPAGKHRTLTSEMVGAAAAEATR